MVPAAVAFDGAMATTRSIAACAIPRQTAADPQDRDVNAGTRNTARSMRTGANGLGASAEGTNAPSATTLLLPVPRMALTFQVSRIVTSAVRTKKAPDVGHARTDHHGTVRPHHKAEQCDPVGRVDGAHDVPPAAQPEATVDHCRTTRGAARVGDHRVGIVAPDRVDAGGIEQPGGQAEVPVPHVPGDCTVEAPERLEDLERQRQAGLEPAELDRCLQSERTRRFQHFQESRGKAADALPFIAAGDDCIAYRGDKVLGPDGNWRVGDRERCDGSGLGHVCHSIALAPRITAVSAAGRRRR